MFLIPQNYLFVEIHISSLKKKNNKKKKMENRGVIISIHDKRINHRITSSKNGVNARTNVLKPVSSNSVEMAA